MDKTQIIILAAVAVVLGFRLYQKYGKQSKDKSPTSGEQKNAMGSKSGSAPREDDYEPYAKK
jgi:hypothetical protein